MSIEYILILRFPVFSKTLYDKKLELLGREKMGNEI